jgi:ribosomal protein S16
MSTRIEQRQRGVQGRVYYHLVGREQKTRDDLRRLNVLGLFNVI